MEQKVIKVGNSLAVTLPRNFVKESKLRAGQRLLVDADPELGLVQVRTTRSDFPSLTPEFKQWLDKVSRKYAKVIKELAKR